MDDDLPDWVAGLRTGTPVATRPEPLPPPPDPPRKRLTALLRRWLGHA